MVESTPRTVHRSFGYQRDQIVHVHCAINYSSHHSARWMKRLVSAAKIMTRTRAVKTMYHSKGCSNGAKIIFSPQWVSDDPKVGAQKELLKPKQ
jgi:hypothetical protein